MPHCGHSLADALDGRHLRLLAGERPRLLVLRVQRAGEEPAVAAEADDHRVALGADLVGRLGREVAALELAALLVHERLERPVEGAQQRHPRALAARDLVELLLHARRELQVHELAEVLDQQVGHDLADELRLQPALLDGHVAAIDDGRDGRRVRGRPPDAVLLERLDERRLRVARRRLGEVLGGRDLANVGRVALCERRQLALLLLLRRRRRRGPRCRRGRSPRTASGWRWRAGRSGPADRSTVVVSSSFGAICEAMARCQMRRYSRSSSTESWPASESGSRAKLVGRIASWASCAPFDLVL